eukprot:CAMPEP_0177195968 /NCGR_PEP_ID=MMETSP0367-20130122/23796_1 /TAXON_ID=447022 ORGANISM="Scrippsiella hangoei-like, Strain SHHI-4" /NCGR_SAMPLE_ID=MMETSP0367 /ASSEMBLY_ACC=CAM_ASM_000362 /LENGTH=268 /DNA_ID=CAMNT_0018644031 /DNA_START=58 /DNA_END=861 /DNA_ORIENTATION=-
MGDDARIWVGGLPDGIDEDQVKDEYKRFGEIKHVQVRSNNGTRLFAFVQFFEKKDAEEAVRKTDQTKLFGMPFVKVSWAGKGVSRAGGGGGGGKGKGPRSRSPRRSMRSDSRRRSPPRRCSRSRSRSRSGGGGADRSRIQQLVDDRQNARRSREFEKADSLRDELNSLGVNVDDTDLTWRCKGMDGSVSNGGQPGIQRKDGDWDCPKCGKMVLQASRSASLAARQSRTIVAAAAVAAEAAAAAAAAAAATTVRPAGAAGATTTAAAGG